MRLSPPSEVILKVLKCVAVFLAFLIVVLVPLYGLSANPAPPNSQNGASEAMQNFLSMLGGGGIGVAGSNFIQKKQQQSVNQWEQPDPSGFHQNTATLRQKIDEVERRSLENVKALRNNQKKLTSKMNALEFFLGQKFEDFKRKDTEY